MPVEVWVATAPIHLGEGSNFVRAYNQGNVVPDSVVAAYDLDTSGLVASVTINDDGTSPNYRGTDPVTQAELADVIASLEQATGGTAENTPDTIMRRHAEGWSSVERMYLGTMTTEPNVAARRDFVDAQVASAKDRANHTGTQPAATISDLREAVEDYVAALLAQGTNVTLTYTDNGTGAGSLTIGSTGGGTLDAEAVRDAIGIALVGVGLVSVTVNDAGDTITISTTATANSTDAQLRDRSTHTGTQAADTITETTSVKMMTSAERTKLAGIATAATANATDAQLRDRSTHTGTEPYSAMPAGYTHTARKPGGVWEGAPTTRTDVTIIWKGPDPSPPVVSSRTLGQAGMLDGVDTRFVTP